MILRKFLYYFKIETLWYDSYKRDSCKKVCIQQLFAKVCRTCPMSNVVSHASRICKSGYHIHTFSFIRIFFIRITKAQFAKYPELLKNHAEARLSDSNNIFMQNSENLNQNGWKANSVLQNPFLTSSLICIFNIPMCYSTQRKDLLRFKNEEEAI